MPPVTLGSLPNLGCFDGSFLGSSRVLLRMIVCLITFGWLMCSVVKSRRFTFLVVSPRVLVHTVISRTIAPRFCRGYCLFDLFGLYHLVSLFSWVKPYQDLSWSLFQGPFQLPNLKVPIIYCISSIQRRNVSCQPLKIGLSNSSSCCSAGRSDTGRVAEYPALHGGTRLPAHNN